MILLVLTGFLHPCISDSSEKGVLIFPFKINNQYIGEPGQVVAYSYIGAKRFDITLTLDGVTYKNIPEYHIIPYDTNFSPARIYLYLKYNLKHNDKNIWTDDKVQESKYRYLLAKNVCTEFSAHPLYEDFLALLSEASEVYELISTEGMVIPTISVSIAKEYLNKFPQGKYYDEVEWRLIQLENYVYEYEGDAGLALSNLIAYENYLNKKPNTKMADEIKLQIAYLCLVISESLADDVEKKIPAGFIKEDIVKFRLKAKNIYQQLLKSKDLEVCATARVALYNIEQGRNVYISSSDW